MRHRSPLSVAFGQLVRELREEASLSQERLGFLAKLSRVYVGEIERGEKKRAAVELDALVPRRKDGRPEWRVDLGLRDGYE